MQLTGHEAYDGLFAHLFSTTDPDCTACLTLTGGIFDGPVPWEPKPLEPTAE